MSSTSFTHALSQSCHSSMVNKDLLLHKKLCGYHTLLETSVYVKASYATI